MAANSPAANQGSDQHMDSLIFILVAIGTVLIVFWMLWKSNSEAILAGLFWTVGHLSKVAQYVPWLYPDAYGSNFANWSTTLDGANVAPYGWDAAKQMIGVITHTLTLIFVPLILLRLLTIRKTHVINRFVRRFNLEKLVARNAPHYAAIASVQHENLLHTPIHEGPLAIARQPIDFALENQLVVVHKKSVAVETLRSMLGVNQPAQGASTGKPIKGWTPKKMRWSVEERRRVMPHPARCRLDTARADKLLVKQLGPHFNVKSLDKFERCVLAILLTANVEGLKNARTVALRLAKSYRRTDKKGRHKPTIDDSGIDAIIQKHIKKPLIRDILKQHAFKATVFMGLLERSWRKGIFTTSEFLWFKGVNRTLYLSMNCLGGDRPFSEALGPWAHYMLECVKKKAIKVPCVEAGTDALNQMLFDEEWIGSADGLASEIAARKALESGNDDQYSPTRGIDLFDPPPPPQ